MAKKLYAEVGGYSRRVKKLYTEVNGVSRRVKKLYAEVGGASKLVFVDASQYFTKYEQAMGYLIGSYELTIGNTVLAKITGYTGGSANTCALGWTINAPAGAEVEITYEWYKGAYPMHDVIIYSANGTLATHSDALVATTSTLKTTNHTGWIVFIINFFPINTYSTTSWFAIKSLRINGEQVFP